ncbi:MAG: enoyl-CoA hydratase/isomerase family protein [Paracoccaceae bacterium]
MELPSYETLDLEADAGWLTVWFNSPENRNALTDARVDDILSLCTWLQDAPLRGVLFRGRGGGFCAGGDLKSFKSAYTDGVGDSAQIVAMSLRGADMFDAVAGLPQYTVMAVEGAAMAGGMGLACCGDFVIATDDAMFGLSEVRIGLTPAQIAPFVIRRMGLQVGRQLMLTGARFRGEEAKACGMVDEWVPDAEFLEQAIATQQRMIEGVAPGALAAIKAQIAQMPFQTRTEQRQTAAESFTARMLSDEAREGIGAFFEKRKPNWDRE